MKRTILTLMIVVLASSANAEPLKWKLAPYVALGGGQALDTVTTLKFLQGSRCVERNKNFGPRPSAAKLVGAKAGIVGAAALMVWISDRENVPKAARWLSKGMAYFGGALGAKDGIRNLHVCGW